MTADAPVRLYNSLGRRVDTFVPLTPGRVGIYTCGPTVYSAPHLGNLRPYVFADTLRRLLEWKGYRVTQVVNITDVGHTLSDDDLAEDKVEMASRRERRSVEELTAQYTQAFLDDLAALRVRPATHYPRASDYVPQMIEFARRLDERGFTYPLPSGLYFDTSRSAGYGRLAGSARGQEQTHDRARVEVEAGKRTASDFAVWRADAPGERRVMRWDSPWGPGVPGWHLECSAMSIELLGPHFDIHTGGVDHREIHHPNEIAQSEAYLGDGQDWVPWWLHNEFLLIGREKMSKSAGTMPVLADLTAAGFHPTVYRYFLLTAHYRSQLELTDDGLASAGASLRRLAGRVAELRPLPDIGTLAEAVETLSPAGRAALARFDAALSDDLNTPRGLAELQSVLRDETLTDADRAGVVASADAVLGLGLDELDPDDVVGRSAVLTVPAEYVERLVAERARARQERRFADADQLRERLRELGVQVTDTADGTRWAPIETTRSGLGSEPGQQR